ncbi:uncharacterized protein HMPREF1541_00641 [Cyphellophora europaea CBS 101466]|uniref:DNA repair protein RAD50 n=1 Tax=Cyphellophora europaea (strain CBS 101466) TaxID=1220924 RepID=W2SCP1_CYPE1|nr:uncharacterized protein HMPREF1541_00641 [Cyphellophora europaea CBS 101466]ETN46457.1 hypothetical protein HMPREF1541_00641 [Cyphellophora europaea CBS 101466]
MSHLDRLGIQGIRSFDSRGARETIVFYSPLTLVVGVNGSGKTTIIESLKYAFTGILPPGAKVGGAFIHDPKLNGDNDSNAQIKVGFTDTKGIPLVATRNLQLTIKKTARSMKTLECSLSIKRHGERSAISARVAELDQIMPQYLGASTAVLENVIFCHQEDSLWPLSDSASLKRKFDEIFEAEKYTKAIKNIADIRKSQKIELDKMKIIEAQAKQDKDRASQAKKKSLQLQDEIEKMRSEVEDLGERMIKAQERAHNAHQESEGFARILGQLEGKRIEAASRRENVESLRSTLKEMSESDEWIESTLEQFDENQQELEGLIVSKKEQYMSYVDEIEKRRSLLDVKLAERGKFQQDKEEYNRQLARRKATIRDVASKHNIRGYDDLSDDQDVEDFLYKIRKQHKERQSALDRAKRDHNAEKEQARSQINKLTTQREALQHNKISANRQIALNNREAGEYQKKADNVRVDEGTKATIETRIDELKEKIDNAQKVARTSAWPEKLKESNSSLSSLEADGSRLSNELVRGTKRAGETARLALVKQEMKERQRSLQTLVDAHSERLKSILGHDFQPSTLERSFQDAMDNVSRDLNLAQRERDATKQELEQVAFRARAARTDLAQQNALVKSCEQKIAEATGDEAAEYEQTLMNAETAAEDARGSGGGAKQLQEYFEKVLASMDHPTKPACRTCNRTFKGPDDPNLKKTKERVESWVRQAIEQEKGSHLEEAEEFLKAVQGVRAAYDNWKQAGDITIPALKKQLENLESEKETVNTTLEKRDAVFQEREEAKKALESIAKTVASIAKYDFEVKDFSKQADELSVKQSQQSGGRTLDDIEEEISSVGEQIRKTKIEITRLTGEQEQSRSNLTEMSNDLHHLQSELKSTGFELEKKASLLARVDEYKSQNQKQRETVEKADSDIQGLDPEIETAKTKLDDISERADANERELSREASELTSSVQSLDLLNDQISAYLKRGGDNQLANVDREIQMFEGEIKSLTTAQGKLSAEVNKLNDQKKDGESTRRQYADNLRYRHDNRALEQLRKEIEELESHNADIDRARLMAEAEKFTREHNVLSAKQSNLMGSMHAQDQQLGDILQQFKVDFKDAPRRYTDAHIKVETTKAAVEDLARYGGALDKAIMKFHSLKMSEINNIISDLWQAVYQGTDIDTIEIRADGDASTGKKSHNYRVMMVKNGTEMDMRGRCSAGQKVLASIIIRLALAECFSTNCGVFALDEPTTNLDQPNIEALAKALHGIIKAREGQSNFQLIVITHDEEFLRHMQCGDFADYYYRVSRNDEQKSIIERQSIAAVM